MSHIFTSAREIRRDNNLPIKNMITFKLKIKFLFKVTKKCTATQHQPSFLETLPLVLTNPTGYNFLSTCYQLCRVAEFFHKEIKIRLSSLRVGWPRGSTTWVQGLCLMGGRPGKCWNAIDVPLESRTVPPAAWLRPGHPRDGLNWVPSTPRVTLFTASPWGLTHLLTFCLATQYLFQGKGRKYYFSKRGEKKKKTHTQDLRSGSPHRPRCCPVTHPPLFIKDKAADPASEATVPDPRAGGGAGLKVSCGDPSPWRMDPPSTFALPSLISTTADHTGPGAKRPP